MAMLAVNGSSGNGLNRNFPSSTRTPQGPSNRHLHINTASNTATNGDLQARIQRQIAPRPSLVDLLPNQRRRHPDITESPMSVVSSRSGGSFATPGPSRQI